MLPACGYEAVTGAKVREENKSQIAKLLSFIRTFLLVFAVISIFVGAFIIFNTFSMLVAQRSRELALLRAVGASRKQVTRACWARRSASASSARRSAWRPAADWRCCCSRRSRRAAPTSAADWRSPTSRCCGRTWSASR